MTACIPMPPARAISRVRSGNISNRWPKSSSKGIGCRLPHSTNVDRRHRRAFLAAKRLAELGHVLQHAVDAPASRRVDVFLRTAPDILIGGVLAPHLPVRNEKTLLRREA